MGHCYRFKRGDRVVIVSGYYQGRWGFIDSCVFQRTVDYPDELAPGYYRRGIILAAGHLPLKPPWQIV
jgi:hypothetical protein